MVNTVRKADRLKEVARLVDEYVWKARRENLSSSNKSLTKQANQPGRPVQTSAEMAELNLEVKQVVANTEAKKRSSSRKR
jgi:cell division protein ZapA (FtsZ GTPase activity inhibitor)